LRLALTDEKGVVHGANAGTQQSEPHETNDVVVVEHLAMAFEHYRATAGGPEQEDSDDDE
jgi:hypothetical protein